MKLLRIVVGSVLGASLAICWPANPIARSSEPDAVGREATASASSEPDWVRAGLNVDQPVWGLRGGLVFGIHPDGNGRRGGAPRGLIRMAYPLLDGGEYELVNLVAIEPVVQGRRGFSELESSSLDGVPGKRIWASAQPGETPPRTSLEPGKLTRPVRSSGFSRVLPPEGGTTNLAAVEQLEVVLRIERFDNGAHVYLLATERSDAPDEIRLTVHAEPDSAPIENCILTATMGNKARTRLLWLKDEAVSSRRLYADYRQSGFAPHSVFPLERLFRTPNGDVLVAITTDEQNPAAVFPFPGTRHWYYGGAKVTQYWRKPNGTVSRELSAAVNARYTYWQSRQPIPGGVAFENFELREPFADGQCFVFGMTRRTPAELGFPSQDQNTAPPGGS